MIYNNTEFGVWILHIESKFQISPSILFYIFRHSAYVWTWK